MQFRLNRLLKEIELLLHWSNESIELRIKYYLILNHKIRLACQYRQALKGVN